MRWKAYIIFIKFIDMNNYFKMLINFQVARHLSLNVSKNQTKNYYDCLGITPKATQGDIKNAYYKLSKLHHPDTNSGNASAGDKFREIAEAYEILGNLKARKRYDRGILTREKSRDDSQSEEPVKEKYEHASFYHQRNKPLSTKSTIFGTSRYYNMDEWTKSHYSETFTASREKVAESREYVDDKIKSKKDNIFIAQLLGVLVIVMSVVFMFGTDPSKKYDVVNLDRPRHTPQKDVD